MQISEIARLDKDERQGWTAPLIVMTDGSEWSLDDAYEIVVQVEGHDVWGHPNAAQMFPLLDSLANILNK
jgi:hypothetical protein